MATKNLVPRATGEGQLGPTNKKWNNVYAVQGNFDQLKTTSNTELFQSTNTDTLTITQDAETKQYKFTAIGGGASTGDAETGIAQSADGSGGLQSENWKFTGSHFLPTLTDISNIGSTTIKLSNIFSKSSVLDTVDTDRIKLDKSDASAYFDIELDESDANDIRLKFSKFDPVAAEDLSIALSILSFGIFADLAA